MAALRWYQNTPRPYMSYLALLRKAPQEQSREEKAPRSPAAALVTTCPSECPRPAGAASVRIPIKDEGAKQN